MNIGQLVDVLSKMARQAGQAIQKKMTANDLTNPESLIQVQFAVQQYSTFISYESSIIKVIKDMLGGIIANI